MKKSVICPKCAAHLCVRDYIVLTVRKKNSEKALVFLSSELGNYDKYYHNESVDFVENE